MFACNPLSYIMTLLLSISRQSKGLLILFHLEDFVRHEEVKVFNIHKEKTKKIEENQTKMYLNVFFIII